MVYQKILTPPQKNLLENFGFTKKYDFYLAGGTALALHLGHRTSLDLDFYTPKHFNNLLLERDLGNFGDVSILQRLKDTLIAKIGDVEVSFFYYPYSLIRKAVKFQSVDLASVPDIAAMKVVALSDRGKRRDFIDLYFLLEKYSVGQLIEFTEKRYPVVDELVMVRGMGYFADADADEERAGIRVFEKGFSWARAKDLIEKEVKKYQLKLLK